MPRFFIDYAPADTAVISGEDAAHITRSLRMKEGEEITLCDQVGWDYKTEILSLSPQQVVVRVLEKNKSISEMQVGVTLYQALPKGDKLDFIIQKAVELGAVRIVPVLTSRCVSRPKAVAMERKVERLQRVALEAAKQSGRGIVPKIGELLNFTQAIEEMTGFSTPILLYENATKPLSDILKSSGKDIAVMVGSEGGFAPQEVEQALAKGIPTVSLGARILRAETAPICVLSVIAYATGEF